MEVAGSLVPELEGSIDWVGAPSVVVAVLVVAVVVEPVVRSLEDEAVEPQGAIKQLGDSMLYDDENVDEREMLNRRQVPHRRRSCSSYAA